MILSKSILKIVISYNYDKKFFFYNYIFLKKKKKKLSTPLGKEFIKSLN